MGRPRKPESEKKVNVGLYVPPQHLPELNRIVEKEDRDRGYVTRALYLRGVAAYQRDGQLIEPEQRAGIARRLRIVGRVSAGAPIEAVLNEDWIEVSSSDLEGVRNPRALRVVGDSMIDAMVLDGDIIIVGDVGEPYGKIVVAEIAGEGVTLKRWRQSGSRVTLEPANPEHKSRTVSATRVKATGVLIKSIRSYQHDESQAAKNAA